MTPARFIASGFGAGLMRPAPGTWGSLAALIVGAFMLAASPWLLGAGVVAAIVAGFWAIPRAGGDLDPGWVVIDEVAGMWLTMMALPAPSWLGLMMAFALFRLLDITKPGPIGMIDRRPGPIGVMGDDLAAGLVAALLLWGFQSWSGLP